jgi:hypothetical protein
MRAKLLDWRGKMEGRREVKRDGDGDGGQSQLQSKAWSRIESQLREFDGAKKARTTRPLYTLSLSRSQNTVSNPSSRCLNCRQTLHESVMTQVSGKK